VGVPGTSSGIEIARRLGLPEPVVERARAQLTPESREATGLIAYLHRSRDELEELKRQALEQARQFEQERQKLQTEWVARQRQRLAELEQRFTETLQRYEAEIARVVEGVRERELRAQLEKQARRRMSKVRAEAREEVDAAVVQHLAETQQDLGAAEPAPEPVTPERLVPGVRVRVRGFGPTVVLRRLIQSAAEGRDAASAEVEAGPLRMNVPLGDITAIVTEDASSSGRAGAHRTPSGQAQGPIPARGITVHVQPPEEPVGDEINVIGCTVEEATRRVDKFLDQAALAARTRVRIIHGHGTGALRRGLAEFFSSHPLVEKIYAEEADRGGAAVTVVELKS
jgi:DNA mismatch repair protein MutS2